MELQTIPDNSPMPMGDDTTANSTVSPSPIPPKDKKSHSPYPSDDNMNFDVENMINFKKLKSNQKEQIRQESHNFDNEKD